MDLVLWQIIIAVPMVLTSLRRSLAAMYEYVFYICTLKYNDSPYKSFILIAPFLLLVN
jgi:hypothetical protein